mgnify:CR=1 FL=1
MKKVLITGAAGFLGSHLSDRFLAEGFHVVGMDNLITGNMDNISHLFKEEHFEFYQQLIALRKAHPAFRMPSTAMIQKYGKTKGTEPGRIRKR